ncbi:unnamed protein product [Ambrosiozyma monospora]|uniref:Unnamed protein product n=1 Tax=Ambrosiozyma monospora TaxID=43982 RepID=A0ACB5UBR8_AMBMO|nr:unnamed protein product [Ambrosiozyma monospora]
MPPFLQQPPIQQPFRQAQPIQQPIPSIQPPIPPTDQPIPVVQGPLPPPVPQPIPFQPQQFPPGFQQFVPQPQPGTGSHSESTDGLSSFTTTIGENDIVLNIPEDADSVDIIAACVEYTQENGLGPAEFIELVMDALGQFVQDSPYYLLIIDEILLYEAKKRGIFSCLGLVAVFFPVLKKSSKYLFGHSLVVSRQVLA